MKENPVTLPCAAPRSAAAGRRIQVLLAALLAVGCAESSPAPAAELALAQRASLDYVYYDGNPRPALPGTGEVAAARARLDAGEPWERELLESLYPGDGVLQALALRDSDGDGVVDFRVSDYYGRFLEGDTDLDGDGLDNVLDTAPFEADESPVAAAGLPAHLSWSGQGKPADMVLIQRELFERHRILLVERSAAFTPSLARSVYDAVTRVYRGVFGDDGSLQTLRVIATAESSLLDADAEEGAGDFAQVFAATQTMEIYRRGIDAPPVIQLGFLAHELGHNIQFAMDYDRQRQEEIIRRNYVAAPAFHALVADYGWTLVALEANPERAFSLFRPQYTAEEPYAYLYRDETLAEWETWLGAIYEEVGEEAYLTDRRLVERNILGDYSLAGPWEWYSDHVIAHVYLAMLDSLADECADAGRAALADTFQRRIVQAAWPYFRFENARGAAIQDYLRASYPLAPEDARALAQRYLLDALPQFCNRGP